MSITIDEYGIQNTVSINQATLAPSARIAEDETYTRETNKPENDTTKSTKAKQKLQTRRRTTDHFADALLEYAVDLVTRQGV